MKREEIINMFMHLCNEMGKSACISTSEIECVRKWGTDTWYPWCKVVPYGTIGAWQLDYVACYGGWNIEEVCNDKGGISHPMGSKRYKQTEFFSTMCFAREILRIRNSDKQ